jgi:hypothetical protein
MGGFVDQVDEGAQDNQGEGVEDGIGRLPRRGQGDDIPMLPVV